MFRLFLRLLALLMIIFILPGLAHLGIWSLRDKPDSWRTADWTSANVLPRTPARDTAAVYVLSARTGGLKGAFATHSWLVLKKPGTPSYDRYDVVGWGRPVRRNGYDADGRWYSNPPQIDYVATGAKAAELIPRIEAAILAYRWSNPGDYTIWPGPNSNTFVASIVRAVPGFDASINATAVGRDFPADLRWLNTDSAGFRLSLAGYAGAVLSRTEGFELNFLGLVAGVNPTRGQVKIPAFGSFSLW